MTTQGVIFGPKAAAEIGKTVRRVRGMRDHQDKLHADPGLDEGSEYWGKLTASLSAPSNGLTSPTSCTVKRLEIDPSNPGDESTAPQLIESSDDDDTVWNRNKGLSGSSGTLCRYKVLYGAFEFTWIDC